MRWCCLCRMQCCIPWCCMCRMQCFVLWCCMCRMQCCILWCCMCRMQCSVLACYNGAVRVACTGTDAQARGVALHKKTRDLGPWIWAHLGYVKLACIVPLFSAQRLLPLEAAAGTWGACAAQSLPIWFWPPACVRCKGVISAATVHVMLTTAAPACSKFCRLCVVGAACASADVKLALGLHLRQICSHLQLGSRLQCSKHVTEHLWHAQSAET